MSADQVEAAANGAAELEGAALETPSYDKTAWLSGASDLEERDVFVEATNSWVKVRALSAGQQATIQDQSLSMKGDTVKVDTTRMQNLKFAAAVVEPKFTFEEANVAAHRFGKSFSLVLGVIDEISKATEADIAAAQRRFRPGR